MRTQHIVIPKAFQSRHDIQTTSQISGDMIREEIQTFPDGKLV